MGKVVFKKQFPCRNDMRLVVLLLAHATSDDINAPISQRDFRRPLHIACSVSCLPVVQLLLWVSMKCTNNLRFKF